MSKAVSWDLDDVADDCWTAEDSLKCEKLHSECNRLRKRLGRPLGDFGRTYPPNLCFVDAALEHKHQTALETEHAELQAEVTRREAALSDSSEYIAEMCETLQVEGESLPNVEDLSQDVLKKYFNEIERLEKIWSERVPQLLASACKRLRPHWAKLHISPVFDAKENGGSEAETKAFSDGGSTHSVWVESYEVFGAPADEKEAEQLETLLEEQLLI